MLKPGPDADIENHRLTYARWKLSPNHGGRLIRPLVIVVHYTGGVNVSGAIATLTDPRRFGPPKTPGGPMTKISRRSSHLIGARDGDMVQLVPFDTVAWHAGESAWKGRDSVNLFSIGIEIDNAGPLKRNALGGWQHSTNPRFTYEADQVLVAKHKSGGPERGWLKYTEPQLAALERACKAIVKAYPSITEIVGHEDVAPGRKTDPGPAFPMADFRARLFAGQPARIV